MVLKKGLVFHVQRNQQVQSVSHSSIGHLRIVPCDQLDTAAANAAKEVGLTYDLRKQDEDGCLMNISSASD